MQLKRIVDALGLEVRAGEGGMDRKVEGGYVSDLLSDVIANSKRGDLWITLQIHRNIVAVATLKELAGIVVIGGKQPAEEALKKAEEENLVILTSPLPAFELVGRLYELGIRGSR
jgi:predicted transcriptional regulator